MQHPKGKKVTPTPVRLEGAENDAMVEVQQLTGLSRSEILRRSFRLLVMEIVRRGSAGWLLEETSLHAFEESRSTQATNGTQQPKLHIISTREELEELFNDFTRRAAEPTEKYRAGSPEGP